MHFIFTTHPVANISQVFFPRSFVYIKPTANYIKANEIIELKLFKRKNIGLLYVYQPINEKQI